MVFLDQLLNLSTDELHGTADAWSALADRVARHGNDFGGVVSGLGSGSWTGQAAELARANTASVGDRLAEHEQRLRNVSEVLHSGATELAGVQRVVTTALGTARQYGIDVGADGSVSVSPARMLEAATNPTELAALPGLVDKIGSMIGQALAHATNTDHKVAAALREHAAAAPPAGKANAVLMAQLYPGPGGGGSDPAGSQAAGQQAAQYAEEHDYADLQTLLDEYAGDPNFATAFYQALGPQEALAVVGQVAEAATEDTGSASMYADIQKQMGGLLATATDPSQNPALPDSWTTQLEQYGQQQIDLGGTYQPYGYQLLGVLMHNGNYSQSFLDDVGNDMLGFEQASGEGSAVWQSNMPQGAGNTLKLNLVDNQGAGFDPMTGLMSALSRNKQAGEEFFSPTTVDPGSGEPVQNTNLQYLLGQRRWFPDVTNTVGAVPPNYQSPGMANLASALQTATTGGVHSPTDASIVTQTVQTLDSTFHGVPDNMRPGIANILGAYMGDVNYAWTDGGQENTELAHGWLSDDHQDPALPGSQDSHALFSQQALKDVLGSAAGDPNSFKTLNDAERAYAAWKMHYDATSNPAFNSIAEKQGAVQGDAGTASSLLGVINKQYQDAINSQNAARAAEWNSVLQARGAVGNFLIDNTIGKIPGIGDYAAKGSEALLNAIVSGSQQDVTASNAQALENQYYSGKATADDLQLTALWNNHLWQPNEAPPNTPDYQALYNSDGSLKTLAEIQSDPTASSEFNQWLNNGGGADAIVPHLQQTDAGYTTGWQEGSLGSTQ